jgi:endonuclease YncB( thermonuclease family)
MTATALSPSPNADRAYVRLRREIEAVLITGRAKVEAAWVGTYHETGRLIHEHVLKAKARADYGAKLLERLSTDTAVSVRTLRECVQFYRLFPIRRPVAELGWNNCRLLCQVGDEEARARLLADLKRGGMPTVQLKERVRALNAAAREEHEEAELATAPAPPRLLRPRRGTPDLYRVVARDGTPAADVGFQLYHPLAPADARGLKASSFVQWSDGRFTPAPAATAAELFTYRANVRRVVDGDTLLVSVALPHYMMDEKLRLRGLDCPELDTPEGKAAKRFVDTLLLAAAEVRVTTSKVDKYDRYLADVHLRRPDGTEILLNNELLKNGHAAPMGAEAMDEWVP